MEKLKTGGPWPSRIIAVTFFCLVVALVLSLQRRSAVEPGDDAKHQAALRDLAVLKQGVLKYTAANKKLPIALAELQPKFLARIPADPYGHAYKIVPNDGSMIYIFYYGKDGRVKGYGKYDVDVAETVTLSDALAAGKV